MGFQVFEEVMRFIYTDALSEGAAEAMGEVSLSQRVMVCRAHVCDFGVW